MDPHTIDLVCNPSAQVPWQSARFTSNFQLHLFHASAEAQTDYAQGLRNQRNGMPFFLGVAGETWRRPGNFTGLVLGLVGFSWNLLANFRMHRPYLDPVEHGLFRCQCRQSVCPETLFLCRGAGRKAAGFKDLSTQGNNF